jgi:hypothetical protein
MASTEVPKGISNDTMAKLIDNACAEIRSYRAFFLSTVGLTLVAAPSILIGASKDSGGLGAPHAIVYQRISLALCLIAAILFLVGFVKISPDVSYKAVPGGKPARVNDFLLRSTIYDAAKATTESDAREDLLKALDLAHRISHLQVEARKWFVAGAMFALAAILVGYGVICFIKFLI